MWTPAGVIAVVIVAIVVFGGGDVVCLVRRDVARRMSQFAMLDALVDHQTKVDHWPTSS